MLCNLCGSIALRHVGKKGYCKDHLKEAFEAAKKVAYYSYAPFEYDRYSKKNRRTVALAIVTANRYKR